MNFGKKCVFEKPWQTGRRHLFSALAVSACLAFPVAAQDDGAAANLLFAKTAKMHAEAMGLEGEDRRRALQAVLDQLESIATAHPDSIPGQRIRAGEPLGSIDIERLRAELGGTGAPETAEVSGVTPDWEVSAGDDPQQGISVAENGAVLFHGAPLFAAPAAPGAPPRVQVFTSAGGSEAVVARGLGDTGLLDLALVDLDNATILSAAPLTGVAGESEPLSLQSIDWHDTGAFQMAHLSRPGGWGGAYGIDRATGQWSLAGSPAGSGTGAAAEPVEIDAEYTLAEPEQPVVPGTWYRAVMPDGAFGTGFGHGVFPSIGQRTHPGVDVIGTCGSDVRLPYPGVVSRVVTSDDPEFARVGHAVVVDHDKVEGVDTWTFYGNLASAPQLVPGAVAAGTVLGQIGQSPHAEGCHLDFEVRNFEGDEGLFHPEWHRLLPYGDWTAESLFLTGWSAPEGWVKTRQLEQYMRAVGGPGFAQKVGYYAKPRNVAFRGFARQGLDMRMKMAVRWAPEGLHVTVENFVAVFVPNARLNPIKRDDTFTTALQLSARPGCKDCQPVHVDSRPTGMTFGNGRLSRLTEPVTFLIGNDVLEGVTEVNIALEANGRYFLFQDKLTLETPWTVGAPRAASSTWVEDLDKALLDCVQVDPEQVPQAGLRFGLDRSARPVAGSFRMLADMPRDRFEALRHAVTSCGAQGFGLPAQEYEDWKSVDVVFGSDGSERHIEIR